MKVEVEGTETYGNESYAELFERTLLQLGLTTRIVAARIVVDMEKPIFLVSVKMRPARKAVKVADICELEERRDGAFLTIKNESYAPALLALLWMKYGRERIEQLTRLEILVHGVKTEEVAVLELDPGEELKKEVLDAVWRLMPEGFKVRHNLFTDTVVTILATEHVMQPEWIALAQKVHRDMEASEGKEGAEETENMENGEDVSSSDV
jgi:putative methanogenesis marker protein 17